MTPARDATPAAARAAIRARDATPAAGHGAGRAAIRAHTLRRGRFGARFAARPRGRAALRFRCERGQASVELIALLPLALLVGLAILTLLAARSASGQAAAAAQAGAMALLQDAEPRAAARAALPPEARGRATVRVAARKVTVTVRPATRLAFLADALTASASADAGPPP